MAGYFPIFFHQIGRYAFLSTMLINLSACKIVSNSSSENSSTRDRFKNQVVHISDLKNLTLPLEGSGIIVRFSDADQEVDNTLPKVEAVLAAARVPQIDLTLALGVQDAENNDQFWITEFGTPDSYSVRPHHLLASSSQELDSREFFNLFVKVKKPIPREVLVGHFSKPKDHDFAYIDIKSDLEWAQNNSVSDVMILLVKEEKPSIGLSSNDTDCANLNSAHAGSSTINPLNTPAGCLPKPHEEDLCFGDPETGSCIGPAPIEIAQPFSDIGLLDTSYLIALNEGKRQYRINDQSPPDAEIEIGFIAKSIAASSENNSRLCRDLFYATGWTLGSRINPACHLKPAASPSAYNEKLYCRVKMHFLKEETIYDRNCYVSGIFQGEESQIEIVQIVKDY